VRNFALILLSLTALIATSATASAREAQRVEPNSKWVLDYAPERCVLARAFGTGDQSVTLQIISYGDWNGFHTVLTGPLVPHPMQPGGSVRVNFPGDKQERDPVYALEGSFGTESAAAFDLYFGPNKPSTKGLRLMDHERWQLALEDDQPKPDFDRQVDTIGFELDHGFKVTLHVESMAAPLAALRKCVDDLYRSWGIDPEVQKNLSRPPRPLSTTVSKVQNHFPASELDGANGYVRVRLLVDASGQAKSCVVQAGGVDEAYQKAACDNLTGRFEPALDKNGQPVSSMYYNAVVYFIE
jgi:hypothetical protein